MYPLTTYHLHQIFNELDQNKDGLVSIDELMSLLTRLSLHAKQAELELLVGDDKALDFFNFLFFYQSLNKIIVQENRDQIKERHLESLDDDLRKAFGVFDLNNDGFISGEELRIALGRLGLWDEKSCGQDCMQMIGVYDTNSDGLLDFEEFKEMMSMDSLESC
ncbi:probable calcium-binding protein CML44 [Salvia hispanica]|uniref:probable calcium-binding protein CML44 n=1 Tax=Salvia hispanica TaxID=49212 RepID=UPI0020090EF8|nr:probable calcium-binding protein CML44 [Salvia hispanica]